MRGKVKYIDDKWIVEYTGVSYSGGNPNVLGSYSKTIETKTLPLHPENVEIFDVLPRYIKDGDSVKFKQVLVNPMGREVDPNNLGQNHSGCVWYAELLPEKEGPKEIKIEDVFNEEKREKVKQVIHQHKVLKGLSLVNPLHLQMTSNGHGEFPDGYKLTEKGIQYIIEQLNKE